MAPYSSVATKSNPTLVALIHDLKKRAQANGAPIWKDVAQRLEGPTRGQAAVNVSTLERHLAAQETAVVPGKLLAAGTLNKPLTVAAVAFSEGARVKVTKAGGSCVSIQELAQKNPKGTKVRIIG